MPPQDEYDFEKGIPMATKKIRLIMNANSLVIRPKNLSWAPLMDSLKKFTADFMVQGRRQPAIQTR